MRWPDRTKYPPERGAAKMSLPNQGVGRSQGQLRASNGTRSAGRIGQPNRARAARCSTTLGPKSDAVTTSAVAPQRRRYGATVGPLRRCDAATEPLQHRFSRAVETGDSIANEAADSLAWDRQSWSVLAAPS
jgi:hypothetical protein